MWLPYAPVNVSCEFAFIYEVVQFVVIQECPGHVSAQLHVYVRKLRNLCDHITQIITVQRLHLSAVEPYTDCFFVTFICIYIGLLTVLLSLVKTCRHWRVKYLEPTPAVCLCIPKETVDNKAILERLLGPSTVRASDPLEPLNLCSDVPLLIEK